MSTIEMHIEQCDVCEAPHRYPLTVKAVTQGWTYTEHSVGTRRVHMTHRPACPVGPPEDVLLGRQP